jgi:cytoskeletal protein CcmA (bactofilin family)
VGFFQDLKDDISLAVGEMVPDEALSKTEMLDLEEDTAVDEAMKEVEKALAEEFARAESEETSETQEDETIEEDAPVEEEEPAEEVVEESVEEPMEEPIEEPIKESQEEESEKVVEPVIDAAAAQIASIANIVAKEELGGEDFEEREIQSPEELLKAEQEDAEETELEKEVEKAMAEQIMNLAQEEVADETAVITAGMVITGDMVSKGSIDILGKVKGNVEILGKLNISGTIEGDSKAAEVFADAARITGKVTAEGTIKIGQNSVIIGDIIASSAVIAGAVKGDIDVQGPVILDASAVVMGNIKSKSVQINNGAVIEGMCSQCYAERTPINFFDELIQK